MLTIKSLNVALNASVLTNSAILQEQTGESGVCRETFAQQTPQTEQQEVRDQLPEETFLSVRANENP